MAAEAARLHRTGQIPQARALYRQLLQAAPRDAVLLRLAGTAECQLGNVAEGERLFAQSLEVAPNQPETHYNRGAALQDLGRLADALASYDRAIALKPGFAEAHNNRGNTLRALGRSAEALASYDRAIAGNPGNARSHFNRGVALQDLGRAGDALASYDRALQLAPDFADAHNNRGNALRALGRQAEALASYDRALTLDPGRAEVHANRGNALRDLGRLDDALASYDRALSIMPAYPAAHYSRGVALRELGRLDEALASHDRALALKADDHDAYCGRGLALRDLGRFDEALASFDRALALRPDAADAHCHRGNVLRDLARFDAALASYDRALALRPGFAEAHANRGIVLQDLGRVEEALASCDGALAARPDYAEGHRIRGNALAALRRRDEALAAYDRALALAPDLPFLAGDRVHQQMQLCDWRDLPTRIATIVDGIASGRRTSAPFPLLSLVDAPDVHLRCARLFAPVPRMPRPVPASSGFPGHGRIRIGYFSADFHDHATMHLVAEALERHDRDRFECYGFSFGPDARDAWRQRAVRAFDRFIDVRTRPDREVAALARSLELDVAVDLKGFTQDARPGIFAERAAPVQVAYLGYPGTTGATYMDYLIADRVVMPPDQAAFYTERIVRLPGSYQANCGVREVSPAAVDRVAVGLPERGCVYCCFNQPYKINPDVFAGWMRILRRVEGSVLWLYLENGTAIANLRREAHRAGVDDRRLVFAPHLPAPDHLARLRCADVFLDTHPYNAHTSASDALRMGVPVLTRAGTSFASRVAASLLRAVGMPELVTTTPEDYEAAAVGLGTRPDQLAHTRERLAANLPGCDLFASERFCRHLESAYARMVARCRDGLAPEGFDVS
jgi:predicted O-linked N-acetylglucosamine transferase (SPINDLY family)